MRDRQNISLILKGSLGKYLMIFGKNRMIDSVAAKVSWKPTLKRLKGLANSKKKALMEMVLIRLISDQMTLTSRPLIGSAGLAGHRRSSAGSSMTSSHNSTRR